MVDDATDRVARLIATGTSPGLVVEIATGPSRLPQVLEPFDFQCVWRTAEDALAGWSVRGAIVDGAGDHDGVEIVAVVVRGVGAPGTTERLDALDSVLTAIGARSGSPGPLLVVDVANLGNVDVVMGLLLDRAQRFDDAAHGVVAGTTARLLQKTTHDAGLVEVGRDDLVGSAPDTDLPGSPAVLRAFLTGAGSAAPDRSVERFVRSYRRADAAVEPAPTARGAEPFLSVIMRTQGGRSSLNDALTSLAAQHDRDLEVLLMVHSETDDVVARIRDFVAQFEPGFAASVRVHQVVGGGRSAPLNDALRRARGRYVALLDDDDVVTPNWLSTFRELADEAPGQMVRAACVVQWIEQRGGDLIDFEPVSGFESPYPDRFVLLDNVRANRSPPCSYAMPRAAIEAFRISFDDSLRVCEDWKFELEVARLCGVNSSPHVTSVYRRWRGDGGSAAAEAERAWIEDHERVVDDLDATPTLMPAGTLRRIHELYLHVERLEAELGRRRPSDEPYDTLN